MIKKPHLLGLFLMLLPGYTSWLGAAQVQTTFLVSATVLTDCLAAALALPFLSYNPTSSTPLDANGTINVTCTLSAGFDIGLNQGTGSGATVTTRKMTRTIGGTETLNYTLYQDSNHTTIWGNTVGVDTVHGTGTGIVAPFTIYGRVPASQTVPAAVYNDTITVTVTY